MRISIFLVILFLNCLNAARSGLDSSKPSGGILNWAILQATGTSLNLQNRIFLSSSTTIGQFSSSPRLTYADTLCNTNRPAGVGTAKALIGIDGGSPTEVRRKGTGWVLKASTDYYNLSGQKLFTTGESAGIPCNQTMGGKVADSGNVWTGLNKTCDAALNEMNLSFASSCSVWSYANAQGFYGNAGASNTNDFINPNDASGNSLTLICTNSLYFYCVEQ